MQRSESAIGDVGGSAKDLRHAWGEFLQGYQWAHFATLTFRIESSPEYADREFGRWIRRIEREVDRPTIWFEATEYGRRLGRLHLHALTSNTEPLSREVMQEHWKAGHSRMLEYRPELGATHYLTKYVTKDLADYDVSPEIQQALALHGRQKTLAFYPADRALPESVLRQRAHPISVADRDLRSKFYESITRHARVYEHEKERHA